MAGPWDKYKPAGVAIPIGPQDPLKMPLAQADLAGKQIQAASTAQGMAVERQRLALDQSRAGLETTKAQMEREAAMRAQAEKERERRMAFAPMQALNSQMRRTWDTYAAGPGATEPNTLGALADFNPYSAPNSQFNAAAAGLGQQGLAAFRVPGSGSQSDTELKAFIAANQPSAGDTDASIKEKMANIERRMGPIYAANGFPFKPYRPMPKAAPKAGGGYPDGTVISDGKRNLVRKGGQWVPQ